MDTYANISRTIDAGNSADVEVKLDDPNIPDVSLKIIGRYYREKNLRTLAEELNTLADDLSKFKTEKLTSFTTSLYSATMSVRFYGDGDVHLDIQNQVMDKTGVGELIDHLRKVRDAM